MKKENKNKPTIELWRIIAGVFSMAFIIFL